MKNFNLDGRVMPKRKGSVKPARSSQAASNDGTVIGRRSMQSPKSVIRFNSYRKQGKAGSPPATTSNLYDVLKRVDWLVLFSPWYLISKAKRYTTLLLPTIFVSVFICFSGAAKAQSRQDVGTAEADVDSFCAAIITKDEPLLDSLLRIKYPFIDFDHYPVREYKIDTAKLEYLQPGDIIPDSLLDLPMRFMQMSVDREIKEDTTTLRELGKDRIIALDFWSQICGPCIVSMQKWEDYYPDIEQDINVVGVQISYDFHVQLDIDKRDWKRPQIFGPNAYILNHMLCQGTIVGPTAWIKGNRFMGLTLLKDDFEIAVQEILEGDYDRIPPKYLHTYSY